MKGFFTHKGAALGTANEKLAAIGAQPPARDGTARPRQTPPQPARQTHDPPLQPRQTMQQQHLDHQHQQY